MINVVEFETKSITKTTDYDGFIENEIRYVIVEKGTGKVLDDAQGYGYKTAQGAHKAGWYKFQRGRDHIITGAEKAKEFWDLHPEAAKEIENQMEMWYKELARGEFTFEQIISEVEKRFLLDVPQEILKYIDMLDPRYRKNWNKIKKKKFRR